jgi:hypothetical protein
MFLSRKPMNKRVTSNIQQIIALFTSETKLENRKPRTEKTKAITSAIIGLLTTDNVKLIDIARPNDASKTIKKISLEQNARRLLDNTSISGVTYAKILINKILHLDKFEVIIDRTNWQWGSTDINYFVASVIWNDIAIPLYWQLLDNKGGSSSDAQRMQIIQWIIDVFGETRILNVYADREFPSQTFLSFLIKDSRICSDYIELNEHQIYKLSNQIPDITNKATIHYQYFASANIELDTRLNIIEFNKNIMLVEKLETQFCKLYTLTNKNDFITIRQKYLANKVKLYSNELALLFNKYYAQNTVGFVQRCKESTVIKFGDTKLTVKQLHQNIHKHGNTYIANKICRAFGQRVYISAHLNQRNEYVFIASDKQHKNPFQLYKRRWNIEVLFAKLKTVGFNIESTHITDHNRLFNLLQLISIAYTLCCKIGTTYNLKIKPIKMKKFKNIHNNQIELRMQLSIFKLGFELLKNFINNHLFCTLAIANLMRKIIDSDVHKIMLDKRSHYIQLIASFQ